MISDEQARIATGELFGHWALAEAVKKECGVMFADPLGNGCRCTKPEHEGTGHRGVVVTAADLTPAERSTRVRP